jgi:prepilin signal peptidase PulO-like enzyme (type II secretory pathway)
MHFLLLFFVGILVGSFLSAFTYRFPRRMQFIRGRSICPFCNHVISWYDNIPVLSFIFLGGRCRHCRKKISFRYPLLEIFTGIAFVIVGADLIKIIISLIFISIFVIDLENHIIPDSLIFAGLAMVLLTLKEGLFYGLFAGFLASDLLLLLNLVTGGKGMGLGDVKLAIVIGSLIGMKFLFVWLFFSFLIGAIVGIILVLLGRASLKQEIAFGPFMISGIYLTYLFGAEFLKLLGT